MGQGGGQKMIILNDETQVHVFCFFLMGLVVCLVCCQVFIVVVVFWGIGMIKMPFHIAQN